MTLVIAAVLSVIMVIIDQLTKAAVVAYFGGTAESVTLIPGVLSFCHVENTGAGFSILSGKTVFLILFTAAAMAIILYLLYKRRYKHPLTDWGFCLVLAGGIGNMIDRVFRGGAVVDFIRTDFINFPVFNVADICVTLGAGLIVIYFIIDAAHDSKAKKQATACNSIDSPANGSSVEGSLTDTGSTDCNLKDSSTNIESTATEPELLNSGVDWQTENPVGVLGAEPLKQAKKAYEGRSADNDEDKQTHADD